MWLKNLASKKAHVIIAVLFLIVQMSSSCPASVFINVIFITSTHSLIRLPTLVIIYLVFLNSLAFEFERFVCKRGSVQDSQKLPTYSSPNPTLTVVSRVGEILGLVLSELSRGEGVGILYFGLKMR